MCINGNTLRRRALLAFTSRDMPSSRRICEGIKSCSYTNVFGIESSIIVAGSSRAKSYHVYRWKYVVKKSSAPQSLYEVYLVVEGGESMKEVKTNPVELYKCGWDHRWSYKDCVKLRQK